MVDEIRFYLDENIPVLVGQSQPIRQSTTNPLGIQTPLPQSQRDLFYLAVDFNRRHKLKSS